MHRFSSDLLDAALSLLAGLVPAAFGAAVAVAFEHGLTWSQRFLQWSVGVCVSYFIAGAAPSLSPWPLDRFVVNAISFVVAMIAFKAAPQLITGFGETARRAPGVIADRLLSWIPGKKDDR